MGGRDAMLMLDWAVAARAMEGEALSGDLHVVEARPDGVLVGVVDGLGHGDEAADASARAISVLNEHAHEPLVSLIERCHRALRKTRGAVMSLASFDARENTMTWLGVGNVEGILIDEESDSRQALSLRGGVVGYRLPPLRVVTVPVKPGSMLIFATDGIKFGFYHGLAVNRVQEVANEILDKHGKDNDDALVLVARYRGSM